MAIDAGADALLLHRPLLRLEIGRDVAIAAVEPAANGAFRRSRLGRCWSGDRGAGSRRPGARTKSRRTSPSGQSVAMAALFTFVTLTAGYARRSGYMTPAADRPTRDAGSWFLHAFIPGLAL